MRKPLLYGLLIPSITCIVLCSIWLVLFSTCLIASGGTYSRTLEDGSIACGIPIFDRDALFWAPFQLFGVPLILIGASWRTIAYCRQSLQLLRLPGTQNHDGASPVHTHLQ